MVKLLKTTARLGAVVFLAGGVLAAWGAVARPGTVNYAEGQVSLDGRSVAAAALGSIEVAPGHLLETTNGKAEMLLTPGVFFRLGADSTAKMISPSLTATSVELVRGDATLEVDMLAKENRLDILDHGADVRIEKKGIYELNADRPLVAVYDGKAQVQVGDQTADVGKGKQVELVPGAKLKPQKFDRNQADDLYNWSRLRSQYVAEANASSAQTVVVNNPGWWAGTGWYWNPWYSTWAFVPGAGYFDNPWGFGFYSPSFWYYNPPLYYYGGPVRGFGGRRFVGGTGVIARPAPALGGSGLRFGGGRPAMGGGVRVGGRR